MEDEVNKAYQDGRLVTDTYGVYQQVFDVGGYSVVVKGRLINGHVHIGTAWGRPHRVGRSCFRNSNKRRDGSSSPSFCRRLEMEDDDAWPLSTRTANNLLNPGR